MLVPAVAAAVLLASGQWQAGALLGGLAALAALVFGMWRSQIALAANLLGVSARGLVANPGLIPGIVAMNALAVASSLPLVVLIGELRESRGDRWRGLWGAGT